MFTEALACQLLSELLLLLSGDVELNPSPPKPDIASLIKSVERLEEGQTEIHAELADIKVAQAAQEQLIYSLSNRINILELKQSEPTISAELEETCQIKPEIDVLKAAHINANNRMHRNNLLFLGLNDGEEETWKESEDKILEFCASQLDLKLNSTDTERAHRLGKFHDSKKRPINIKLVNFKTKESILAYGRKQKIKGKFHPM